MLCLEASDASIIASPRNFTTFMPNSKSKTPATVRAVYSPRESPATACMRVVVSGLSCLSFSTPAKPPTYMAGWQYCVISSLDSGPFRQRSSKSKPRISCALTNISFTAGMSFTAESIFTYCDPWPGKRRATGRLGRVGTTGTGTSWIAAFAFSASAFSATAFSTAAFSAAAFSASAFFLASSSSSLFLSSSCALKASPPNFWAVSNALASGPFASSASLILVPSG
mmetsp:Transcript_93338/g.207650  ORF Transcript_93338/g.207650 Transcript_93338/m.207650 type:complete len:226 (+) Transcript_93338:647-1324(+)